MKAGKFVLLGAFTLGGLAVTGCDRNQGPIEQTGEQLDQAGDQIEQGADQAGDKIEQGADEATGDNE